mgnify:CR=1 FL=1
MAAKVTPVRHEDGDVNRDGNNNRDEDGDGGGDGLCGVRLELDWMGGAVAHRGHPERDVPVVHVAGTNGKGSVCALIERALREAGYRTGDLASPHLHQFTERVRIDGEPLSEAEVAERLRELRSALPSMPPLTFFEIATLMAFETFRDRACDVAEAEGVEARGVPGEERRQALGDQREPVEPLPDRLEARGAQVSREGALGIVAAVEEQVEVGSLAEEVPLGAAVEEDFPTGVSA